MSSTKGNDAKFPNTVDQWKPRSSTSTGSVFGPLPLGPGQAFGIRPSACGLRRYPDLFFCENGKNVIRFSVFGPLPLGPGQAFGIRPSAFGLRKYPDHFFAKIAKTVFGVRSSGPCPSGRAGPSFRDSAFGFRSSEVPGPFFWRKWQQRNSAFGFRSSGPCPRAGPSFRDSAFGFRSSEVPGPFFWRKWQKRNSVFGLRAPAPRAGPSFRDSAFGSRSSEVPGPFFWRKLQKRNSVFGLRAPAPRAGPGQAFGIRPSACGLRRYPDHFFGENSKNVIRLSVFGLRAPAPRAGPSFRDSAFGLRSSEVPGPFFWRKWQKRNSDVLRIGTQNIFHRLYMCT